MGHPRRIVQWQPDRELERPAFSVLAREFGLAGYARFLRLFGVKGGDYTAERHEWVDKLTMEEIETGIAKL